MLHGDSEDPASNVGVGHESDIDEEDEQDGENLIFR